jgi:hypothetical protein
MAKTIPQLTDATTVNAADELIIQQGGITKRATINELMAGAINVQHHGAKGDGVTDNTAALQALLDAAPAAGRQSLYFPAGTYLISNVLWVKRPYTTIFCDGHSVANIQLTNTSADCAIFVKNPTAGASQFAFSMHNMEVTRVNSSTYQRGIILESASNTHMTDIVVTGFPTGMDIRGGVNCHYTSIRLSAFGSTNTAQDIGLLEINGSSYAASPTFFTHLFSNCMIAGGEGHSLKITAGDYKTFSNCYFGGNKNTDCILLSEGGIYGNYDTRFDNCYFDYGGLEAPSDLTKAAILIDTEGPQAALSITDCRFNKWGIGVHVNNSYFPDVKIVGCEFQNTNTPFKASSLSDFTAFTFVGNNLRGPGMFSGNASVISIADSRVAVITGNRFFWDDSDWAGTGSLTGTKNIIEIASGATVESLTITGNAIQAGSYAGVTFVDFVNNGTVDQLTFGSNVSDNATSALAGVLVGNKANSNVNVLDWYQEGTWTPSLEFDGATTGITYTARTGSYTRIGNRVYFDCYFLLSSKGAATGAATISGLPFTQSNAYPFTYSVSVGTMAAGLGDANIDAGINSSDYNEIRLHKQSAGSRTNMTDADFENATNIIVTGVYRV